MKILGFIIKKKKYRGHYCWVCQSVLPNEKFSGQAHSNHICKKCSKLSKEELAKISDERFIYDVFFQKNISIENLYRIEKISKKYIGELGEQATVILKVAKLHPLKKKRLGFLYFKHKELFDELVRFGIIDDLITHRIQDEIEYEKIIELQEIEIKRKQQKYDIDLIGVDEYSDDLPL